MRSACRAALIYLAASAFASALTPASLGAKEIEIAPQWSVLVLNEAGRPVADAEVSASWEFYGAAGEHRGNETRRTDAHGNVIFPARTFQATSAGLALGRALTSLNVHASFGPSAEITFSPRGYKLERASYSSSGKVYDYPGAQTERGKDGFRTTFRFLALDIFDFVASRDWVTMKRLLASDQGIARQRDLHGATLLTLVSDLDPSNERTEFIDQLFQAGALVNDQALDGTTALHNAAKNYDIAYMELLLSKGADPKLKVHDAFYYTTNGFTPLHFLLSAHSLRDASTARKIQGIDLLLTHGADIGAQDATGASPLHLAAVWGDSEIVAALLTRGADPLAKNSAGQTPLTSIKDLNDTPEVHRLRELLTKAAAKKSVTQP